MVRPIVGLFAREPPAVRCRCIGFSAGAGRGTIAGQWCGPQSCAQRSGSANRARRDHSC